jgi:hypothetical protein
MKRLVFAAAVLMAIVVVGCNPLGTDETKVYLNGIIYTDSTFSLPAEGIAVMVTGASETYLELTDAGGVFNIEIQLYDGTGGGGHSKGTDGTTPGTVTITVRAINGTSELVYGGTGGAFTVTAGDTLTMYPVDLTMFTEKTEEGTGH